MSNEIPVVDAVFGHYFDSCQISSPELDHAYKEVRDSVADPLPKQASSISSSL